MERHAPLVACETLFEHLPDPDWVVFDVRHDLMDPQAGPLSYAQGHIPGAFHAHIDHDLAGPVGDGAEGRHPLPATDRFTAFLQRHGVHDGDQIVCYDEGDGSWAARLWWLLRHHGHEHVAVLDGGLRRWQRLGLGLDSDPTPPPRDGTFSGVGGSMPIADTAAVEEHVEKSTATLVDVRTRERYDGTIEPVDPVAGHIPGAVNRPFAENLGPDGNWLSPDELRATYMEFDGQDIIMYCGSGVTSAHGLLSAELAGLPTPTLYTGSWSAWCRPSAGRAVEVSHTAGDSEE